MLPRGKPMRRSKAIWLGAVLLAGMGSCVDEKVEGLSTELLLAEFPKSAIEPGASVRLGFQAVDGEDKGVPDQSVEVVITDLARLTFTEDPR